MNERANERYARFVESPFVINCRNDNSDQKKTDYSGHERMRPEYSNNLMAIQKNDDEI